MFIPAQTIVTDAEADFETSATLVAVTLTVGGAGIAPGAAYVALPVPVLVTVPAIELPPATPFTLHVTLCDGLPALAIVAKNVCIAPGATVADVGAMLTTTSLVIVTVAEAVAAKFTCAIAEIVTLAGDGRICGALYSPPGVIVPTWTLPPATPFTVQFTEVLLLPLTLALKLEEFPSSTDALDGVTITVITGGVVPLLVTPPQPDAASDITTALIQAKQIQLVLVIR